MDYRQAPFNREAECCIIGCMLMDNSLIDPVMSRLQAEDFYLEINNRIFAAIGNLRSNNKPADLPSVFELVKDQNNAVQHMSGCMDGVTTTAALDHHVEIVHENSVRRQFIKAANNIMEAAYGKQYESILDLKNEMSAMADIDIREVRSAESSIKNLVSRTLEDIDERYHRTDEENMHYGLPWLDRKTGGAHKSDLTILAARPSVGKTALMLQVAMHIGIKGVPIAIFSLEMPKEQLIERMLSTASGINLSKLRYPKALTDIDWSIMTDGAGELYEMAISIYDDIYNVEGIRAKCRELKNKDILGFVMIDYLQLTDTLKKYSTLNEKVSSITRQFKLMAKEFKVPVWLLSQLTRTNERDNRRPKLMDLRDSGSIEQDADNVFFLHDPSAGKYDSQDLDEQVIELLIGKQRNGKRNISSQLLFKRSTQKFMEVAYDYGQKETAHTSKASKDEASKAARTPYKDD